MNGHQFNDCQSEYQLDLARRTRIAEIARRMGERRSLPAGVQLRPATQQPPARPAGATPAPRDHVYAYVSSALIVALAFAMLMIGG